MFRSRLTLILVTALLTGTLAVSAFGFMPFPQQPGSSAGTHPNNQSQITGEALASLRAAVKRNKNDVSAWHRLGSALEQSNLKEGLKAHEKAAKMGDKLLSAQLDQAGSGAEFAKRLQPIGTMLVDAASSAQKYIQLSPKLSGKKRLEWQLRADSLLAFSEVANAPPGTPVLFSSKEVSVKARVLSKPEPQYTEEARKKQVTGTVVLRAIFAANGQVVGIRAISGLSDGLTQQAINAARRIKFIPAVKDGRPVSMHIQLEYNFNLY